MSKDLPFAPKEQFLPSVSEVEPDTVVERPENFDFDKVTKRDVRNYHGENTVLLQDLIDSWDVRESYAEQFEAATRPPNLYNGHSSLWVAIAIA